MRTCTQTLFVAFMALISYRSNLVAQAPQSFEREDFVFPLMFTENAGQWHKDILYASLRGDESLLFSRSGMVYNRQISPRIPGNASLLYPVESVPFADREYLSCSFINPSSWMKVIPLENTGCVSNFYHGNDSSQWRSLVSNFKRILYNSVWSNIDLEYEAKNGKLLQRCIVNPGGRLSDVRFNVYGNTDWRNSMMRTKAYLFDNARSNAIPCTVTMSQDGFSYFRVGNPIGTQRLILETEYCSFFGGTGNDEARDIVSDSSSIYILGLTYSLDLPTRNAYQVRHSGGTSDYFIAGFECDSRKMRFCTYLGGSGAESMNNAFHSGSLWMGIGSVYMAGTTTSSDFPITSNAVQKTNTAGKECGVIVRFGTNGNLIISTYLGGPAQVKTDYITGDPNGNIYVSGNAKYDVLWFITTGVIQPRLNNMAKGNLFPYAGFVAKLTHACDSIIYATYIYSLNGENFTGSKGNGYLPSIRIQIDRDEQATICGSIGNRAEPFIPIVNAQQPIYGGGSNDVYITKLNRNASDYIYSTWFGGNGEDALSTITMDEAGNLYLCGNTNSTNIPLKNPFQRNHHVGCYDLFASKIDKNGDLLWLFDIFYGCKLSLPHAKSMAIR
jgi:hypothetical protein